MLLAASAIRRERTHNDIYRHLLRPVRGADGAVVAMIGVAYEISGGAHITPGWKATMLAAVIGLGAYWLSLPLWVLFDARDRGERAWPWTTFLLLGNVVALTAYVLARAPQARRG